jgi:hypothetical protein
MSKGVYPRSKEWYQKLTGTLSKTHSIVVTGSPRTGVLIPYIGRVFPNQRVLAREVGVSPRTIQYWLGRGYVGLVIMDSDFA